MRNASMALAVGERYDTAPIPFATVIESVDTIDGRCLSRSALDSVVAVKGGVQGSEMEIHRRMVSVRGNEAPSRRTVCRWLSNLIIRVETTAKCVSTGRPAT